MFDLTKYIKLCCVQKDDISSAELSRRAGLTPQNLNSKYNGNKFSNHDLEKIAAALGAHLEIKFIDNETNEPII